MFVLDESNVFCIPNAHLRIRLLLNLLLCLDRLQLLLQEDDSICKLLVDQIGHLDVPCHSLLQLVKRHQCRILQYCFLVTPLRHRSIIAILINMHHLIGRIKLCAHFMLQVLHYMVGHG